MNERIKLLAEQAKAESSQWLGSKPATTITYDELEKFAKLIIQECADYIRTNYDNWDAEPLAFNMERDYGLHGDYAE
jgi:hypothetical protein